jgi:hypothetical protein
MADLFGALSFLPDSEHIWHLIEVLPFAVAAWELLKHLYRWIFKRRSRLEQKLELVEKETREKTEEIRKLGAGLCGRGRLAGSGWRAAGF